MSDQQKPQAKSDNVDTEASGICQGCDQEIPLRAMSKMKGPDGVDYRVHQQRVTSENGAGFEIKPCGPILTAWVYWVSFAYNVPGGAGFRSTVVRLSRPIRHESTYIAIEKRLAQGLEIRDAAGRLIVGSEITCTLMNAFFIRSE